MGKPTRKTDKGSEKKLALFGHFTRHKSPAKIVLQGSGRKRAKCWTRLDTPNLTRWAEERLAWRSLLLNVSTMSPLHLPSQGISLICFGSIVARPTCYSNTNIKFPSSLLRFVPSQVDSGLSFVNNGKQFEESVLNLPSCLTNLYHIFFRNQYRGIRLGKLNV